MTGADDNLLLAVNIEPILYTSAILDLQTLSIVPMLTISGSGRRKIDLFLLKLDRR